MRRERGTTTVEFAIIGSLAMLVLFTVLEFSRALFVMSTLGEVTRRGVRMAAVCPVNDPAIARTAIFGASGDSDVIRGLAAGNLRVEYLNAAGGVVADPAGGFMQIRYVRVRLEGFRHRMLLPFYDFEFETPGFAATLPRESLGIPRVGAIQPC